MRSKILFTIAAVVLLFAWLSPAAWAQPWNENKEVLAAVGYVSSDAGPDLKPQQLSLVSSVFLKGSFVTSQAVYADSERIYLCSFQGDLFVLERDRTSNFRLIQTISIGSPLVSVRGDKDKVYVSSRNGNLYSFKKTWPLQLFSTLSLSNYGLSSLEVAGKDVYVAKGQAAMTATESRVYISELNPGDFAIEVGSMRGYGEAPFVAGTTLVFDRQTMKSVGFLANPTHGVMAIKTWEDFVFLTDPGGFGVYVYDAPSLTQLQFLNRTTNAVGGVLRRGVPLVVGGSEAGDVDLYAHGQSGFQLIDSIDLRGITGFIGSEDIEVRSLWVDGIDNLVFAASSWGNDQSRSPFLPSFFVLEIRQPGTKAWTKFDSVGN